VPDATPLAAEQALPTKPDQQVVESWQEVDSLIERMQSAVREYAKELTDYVDAREQAQEQAAEHIKQQMLEELRDQREQIEAAQQSLDAERQVLETDRAEVESRWAEVERAQKELDDRETRLDQQHTQQEQTQRSLDQLESRLAADRKAVESLEQEHKARQDQLESRTRELDERQAALDTIKQDVQQRQDDLNQRAEKLETKEQQFKRTADRVTNELREQKDKQTAALKEARQQQEAELKRQREQQETELAARREQQEAELTKAQQHLEGELAEAKQKQEAEFAERTRETQADLDQRVATVARRERKASKVDEELDARRAKLHQYKEILEQRSHKVREQEAEVEPMRRAAEAVLAKRDEVNEAQQSLAETETAMIRRWGMHRASGLAIAAMVLLGVIAGISHVAGGWVSDQTWAATAVVQHQTPLPAPPDAWLAEQQQLIADTATIDRALMTMRQIGYTGPATPQHIRQMIDSGLTVHSPAAGVLHLELRGPRQSELAPILGGLVRAMSTDAATSMPRPDVAIVQGATLANTPLADNQVARSIQIFIGAAAVSLLVFFGAMFVLMRMRGGQATVLEPIAADAQVWQEHARHLRHNPESESDGAPAAEAPAQTPKKPGKPRKPKKAKRQEAAKSQPQPMTPPSSNQKADTPPAPAESLTPPASEPQVVDTHEQADANAETVMGHHHALDFGNPPADASAREASSDDLHGAPEFKPL